MNPIDLNTCGSSICGIPFFFFSLSRISLACSLNSASKYRCFWPETWEDSTSSTMYYYGCGPSAQCCPPGQRENRKLEKRRKGWTCIYVPGGYGWIHTYTDGIGPHLCILLAYCSQQHQDAAIAIYKWQSTVTGFSGPVSIGLECSAIELFDGSRASRETRAKNKEAANVSPKTLCAN